MLLMKINYKIWTLTASYSRLVFHFKLRFSRWIQFYLVVFTQVNYTLGETYFRLHIYNF